MGWSELNASFLLWGYKGLSSVCRKHLEYAPYYFLSLCLYIRAFFLLFWLLLQIEPIVSLSCPQWPMVFLLNDPSSFRTELSLSWEVSLGYKLQSNLHSSYPSVLQGIISHSGQQIPPLQPELAIASLLDGAVVALVHRLWNSHFLKWKPFVLSSIAISVIFLYTCNQLENWLQKQFLLPWCSHLNC